MTAPLRIAVFVSPHGFGHAARASAVMLALSERLAGVAFDLYTTVPDFFFHQSGITRYRRFPLLCDIGMVQPSPLKADLDASLRRLNRFYPLRSGFVDRLARRLGRRNCRMVLCDIAPLGLAVAQAAGLPGILVENFTWDWIYRGYGGQSPGLARMADRLSRWFQLADCHIQTQPLCRAADTDLTVGPISRPPRQQREATRKQLDIPAGTAMVLVTMGGVRLPELNMADVAGGRPIQYVIPGVLPTAQRRGNCLYLPAFSDHYHPDLMAAADAAVVKAGYSTIAEANAAGLPLGYLTRPGFRESPILDAYIRRYLPSLHIDRSAFDSGRWVHRIPELLQLPRRPVSTTDGDAAGHVADYLTERYHAWLH